MNVARYHLFGSCDSKSSIWSDLGTSNASKNCLCLLVLFSATGWKCSANCSRIISLSQPAVWNTILQKDGWDSKSASVAVRKQNCLRQQHCSSYWCSSTMHDRHTTSQICAVICHCILNFPNLCGHWSLFPQHPCAKIYEWHGNRAGPRGFMGLQDLCHVKPVTFSMTSHQIFDDFHWLNFKSQSRSLVCSYFVPPTK